jgi:hypothetical protein
MKIFSIVLLVVYPILLIAQMHEWKPSIPLTDSSHFNRNACLIHQEADRFLFFDQETDATTTKLCYCVITPAIGEVTVALSVAGVELTHPKVFEQNYYPSSTKVFYQTNEGSDIDLKYFTFSNYTVSDSKLLTDLPGDDINLVAGYSGMVAWENSGKIWVSQYIQSTDSFTTPFAVDSAGAYSPGFSDKLNYLKTYGDSTLVVSAGIIYDQGNWQISDVSTRAFAGNCSSLVSIPPFSMDNPLCMENKTGSDPTGLILFSSLNPQIQYINSAIYNFTQPAILDFKIGVKSGFYFLSYVTDSLGQDEVYTETPMGYEGRQNISLWPGDDRNPGFFESYAEEMGLTIRVYLFWESERQGFSTIYSTYLEYPFGGVIDKSKESSLSVFPCPFDQEITITLQSADKTNFKIIGMLGNELKTLTSHVSDDGCQQAVWDGTDNRGCNVPPGSYLIVASSANDTRSAIVIRKK